MGDDIGLGRRCRFRQSVYIFATYKGVSAPAHRRQTGFCELNLLITQRSYNARNFEQNQSNEIFFRIYGLAVTLFSV